MLKKILDSIHMAMHFLIALIIAKTVHIIHPDLSIQYFLLPSLIGSFAPDIDHLLYFSTYGRKAPYSKRVRRFLRSGNIFGLIRYCAAHHKELTGLYSHTGISICVFLIIGFVTSLLNYWWLGVMIVAIIFHFLFDIFEDILILKKLNENWLKSPFHINIPLLKEN